MIDARHCQGDRFQYDGAIQYVIPVGVPAAPVVVVAELRKAHGGVKIGDLSVLLGVETVGVDATVFPFSINASMVETAAWPAGPIVLTVTVSCGEYCLTSRPISIHVHSRGA